MLISKQEIKEATNKFHHVISSVGFGTVYGVYKHCHKAAKQSKSNNFKFIVT